MEEEMHVPLYKYLSVPYKDGGDTMDGADCWGLVSLYMRQEAGIEIPAYAFNPYDTSEAELLSQAELDTEWERAQQPWRPLDVALFMNGDGLHIGVIIDHKGGLLNAVSGYGSALVLNMSDQLITRTLIGVYRHVRS